jgi:UDPglucose 6-dehydrogenase
LPVNCSSKIVLPAHWGRPNCSIERPTAASHLPEFLRAGRAVRDFLQPDRVIIGAESDLAAARLTKLYRSIGIEQERILMTDRRSSELIRIQ